MPHAGRMIQPRICFYLDYFVVTSYKKSCRNMVNICSVPLWSVFSMKSLRVILATLRCIPNFSFLLWRISTNRVFPPWRNKAPYFEILNSGSVLKQGFLQIRQTLLLTGSYVSAAHMERWKFFVKRHKVLLEAEMWIHVKWNVRRGSFFFALHYRKWFIVDYK